MQTLTVLHISN